MTDFFSCCLAPADISRAEEDCVPSLDKLFCNLEPYTLVGASNKGDSIFRHEQPPAVHIVGTDVS
jgi:hypothetical protein